MLQLFNRVRPLKWLGGLIGVRHKIQDGPLQLLTAGKMVRLEKLALEQTEPDLNLIEPRGIGRKPIELHRQFPFRLGCQFGDPSRELLGCVSRTIIEHQSDRLHPTALGFRNENGFSKGAEVDKPFARVALTIDQPIGHGECRHQVHSSTPMVAR